MNRKENKYEAIDMLDLNDKVEDIIDIYISRIYHTDKTVGIIVNKEFAEYIMGIYSILMIQVLKRLILLIV